MMQLTTKEEKRLQTATKREHRVYNQRFTCHLNHPLTTVCHRDYSKKQGVKRIPDVYYCVECNKFFKPAGVKEFVF